MPLIRLFRHTAIVALGLVLGTLSATAQDYVEPPSAAGQPAPTYGEPPGAAQPAPQSSPSSFSAGELVTAGHQLFGDVSQGLAGYGEGILYTRNAGQHRVYWQGPSIGLDVGADGDRTMMLVYNLPSVESIFQRFLGVNGSAYVVAGFGMTVLSRNGIYVVPIVSGVGARLGVNFGYLKFTANPTWNPF